MGIWVIGALTQLFTIDSLLKLDFQKNELVSRKILFFVIDPFCTPHLIFLNIGF